MDIFRAQTLVCIPINVLTTATTNFVYSDNVEEASLDNRTRRLPSLVGDSSEGLQSCGHASYRHIKKYMNGWQKEEDPIILDHRACVRRNTRPQVRL
jgi:hypothetical protein